MKFVIAGGGTTGHLSPGLAVAAILRDAGHEVIFIGSTRGPEGRIVPSLGYGFHSVDVEGRGPGVLTPRNVRAAAKLALSTVKCLGIIGRFHPTVVVGTGGYASLPAALASRVARIPLVVHEQNSVPGLANRVAKRFARKVGVSFPGSEKLLGPSAVFVGNPVRAELSEFSREEYYDRGIKAFELAPGRPTLLVFGGSQGAQSINEAAAGAYDLLRAHEIQVLHLAGPAKADATRQAVESQTKPEDVLIYKVVGYTDSMQLAYACSDLALCRAGASTIAELAAVGLPGILVPLPIALDDDQKHNAQAVVETGGARMILDRDLNPEAIASVVNNLLLDPAQLKEMGQSIGRLACPDAAQRLADLIMEVAVELEG